MDSKQAFAQCTRYLNGHGPRKLKSSLEEAIAQIDEDETCDIYGKGSLIESFESDMAVRLGKQAAVFMPSGTMAQQIAMRIWCDLRNSKSIAMHRTSHLAIHEEQAYQKLHGMQAKLLADTNRLFTYEDLLKLEHPVAAILWELPQREIGGQLPSWDDLKRETLWAKDEGIARHLDGARLWEAVPHYGRKLSVIAGLFDSVYVSFYKGLGGIAGAILAGDSEFIAESRIWQRRHGGNLISLYPYVLSARAGLTTRLSQFGAYRQRAQSLAQCLGSIQEISVVPKVPPTNMMHLHITSNAQALNEANQEIAAKYQVQLFSKARTIDEHLSVVEISLGQACANLENSEVKTLFQQLLKLAIG